MNRTVEINRYDSWSHNDILRQLTGLVIQEIIRAKPTLFSIAQLVYNISEIEENMTNHKSVKLTSNIDGHIVFEEWDSWDPLNPDYIIIDSSEYMNITIRWEDK